MPFKPRSAKSYMLIILTVILSTSPAAQEKVDFDLVLENGRVMDPESGMDEVRNVGIRNGRLAAVSVESLKGKSTVDVSGLVVAPGFIDLHAHGQDSTSNRFQAGDGVTTALELELGTAEVALWYAQREGKSLINYGVSVGHVPVRMKLLNDPGNFVPSGEAASKVASESEIRTIRQEIRKGLEQGAPAVGFGIQYTPAASRREIQALFEIAAQFDVPCHVHTRHIDLKEPGSSIEAVQEVIASAAITGASLHIVHLGSSGLQDKPTCLEMIQGAPSQWFRCYDRGVSLYGRLNSAGISHIRLRLAGKTGHHV